MTSTDPAATDTAPALAPPAGLNHIQLAALSVVLAGVLAVGASVGPVLTLVAVAVVQAVLVPCWVLGNGIPGRIGAITLGLLAAAGADAAVMNWHESGYSPVLGVLGIAIPLMFAHQLTRGVVRTRVVESLAGIAVLVVAAVSAAGLVVLRYEADGRTIALAVSLALGVALLVAHLTDAVLPSPRFDPSMDRGLPAVVLGVFAGGVAGYLVSRNLIDFAGGRSAFVGAAIGAVACLLSIGASFADPAAARLRSGADTAPVTTPVTDAPADPARADAGDVARTAAAAPAEADVEGDEPESAASAVKPKNAGGIARLRPAASVALTVALTIPAAYVLTNALTS